MWDPVSYLRHADERGRPFADLLARVLATDPRTVVDLGCGPGTLTAELKRRWPDARVMGVDASAEMLSSTAADEARRAGVELVEADVREWRPDAAIDVLVTNATLQWVPDHLVLLPRLLEMVAAGGWFAMQVPGNFAEPSHVLLHETASHPRWRTALAGMPRPLAHSPASYLDVLVRAGWRADVWETTYLHVLSGDDAVLGWMRGTALRPVLAALSADEARAFEEAYGARLRTAYPRGPYGTVLPFRRIFAVGQAPKSGATPNPVA